MKMVSAPMAQLRKQMVSGEADAPCRAGCTCGQFRQHIESQFKLGMTWGNYGAWVLDHITPQAFFEEEEEPMMNHFSNLQPLWLPENNRKSDRLGNTSVRVLLSGKRFRLSDAVPAFPEYYPQKDTVLIDRFLCGRFVGLDVFQCGNWEKK